MDRAVLPASDMSSVSQSKTVSSRMFSRLSVLSFGNLTWKRLSITAMANSQIYPGSLKLVISSSLKVVSPTTFAFLSKQP